MNRLKGLRENRGMNMKEAADALGYKYMTYVNYEKEERQMYPEQLIKIADFYGVSIDYLLGRDDRTVVLRSPLDEKYEALDERGRKVVDAVMEVESGVKTVEIPKREKKIIPLFAAAAGPGNPPSQDGFDDYEVDADSKAKFAVKISGDSMEPHLHDGEIVLCQRRRPEIGEFAVMMVDGLIYVKQYVEDCFQNMYLMSMNRNRADCDVTLMASGDERVEAFGTVMGMKFPPVKP